MLESLTLSGAAIEVLRLRVERPRLEVTPENLEAHRELVRAGILDPISTFLRGPESHFRFTEEGWNRREEFLGSGVPR